jgi:hypothetical protein
MQTKTVSPQGQWFIRLYGPDGTLKDERQGHNVVVTAGKEYLASYLSSAAASPGAYDMKYVAVGTDSTAEVAGNTALGSELSRVTGTVSYATGGIVRVTATFPSGSGTGAITEYGLFSTITTAAGTMFSRDTELVINKGANDTLTAITEITFS